MVDTVLAPDGSVALRFIAYLASDCGCRDFRPLAGDCYAAIVPLLFTHAIIIGRIGDDVGYDDRWCYLGYEQAKAALDAWNGTGEPGGWHRHPATGKRADKSDEPDLFW